MGPLEFTPPPVDHHHMTTETSSVAVAPRVTATQLRAVLALPGGVLVHLPSGDTEAAPEGLTKAQSLDPNLVVVLTYAEGINYLNSADGNYPAAALAASAVLRARFEKEARYL